jgi:hypothetical protein
MYGFSYLKIITRITKSGHIIFKPVEDFIYQMEGKYREDKGGN